MIGCVSKIQFSKILISTKFEKGVCYQHHQPNISLRQNTTVLTFFHGESIVSGNVQEFLFLGKNWAFSIGIISFSINNERLKSVNYLFPQFHNVDFEFTRSSLNVSLFLRHNSNYQSSQICTKCICKNCFPNRTHRQKHLTNYGIYS